MTSLARVTWCAGLEEPCGGGVAPARQRNRAGPPGRAAKNRGRRHARATRGPCARRRVTQRETKSSLPSGFDQPEGPDAPMTGAFDRGASGRGPGPSVRSGLLGRRGRAVSAGGERLLVFGHRALRLVRLRLLGFLAASHLTLRHRFLLDSRRPARGDCATDWPAVASPASCGRYPFSWIGTGP
jgi:hypothetical protein